jgi:hypothetical protein
LFREKIRCWFKGNDTTTLCIYFEQKLRSCLPLVSDEDLQYVQWIIQALAGANTFMRTLFRSDLWLLDKERDSVLAAGYSCLSGFQSCADEAFRRNITRWKLQTKFHMVGELLYELEHARRHDLPSLNPISTSTQIDEDFIGRVATSSRTVSSRTLHSRTIQRYLLGLKTNW